MVILCIKKALLDRINGFKQRKARVKAFPQVVRTHTALNPP
jgi:hypothetical protein